MEIQMVIVIVIICLAVAGLLYRFLGHRGGCNCSSGSCDCTSGGRDCTLGDCGRSPEHCDCASKRGGSIAGKDEHCSGGIRLHANCDSEKEK